MRLRNTSLGKGGAPFSPRDAEPEIDQLPGQTFGVHITRRSRYGTRKCDPAAAQPPLRPPLDRKELHADDTRTNSYQTKSPNSFATEKKRKTKNKKTTPIQRTYHARSPRFLLPFIPPPNNPISSPPHLSHLAWLITSPTPATKRIIPKPIKTEQVDARHNHHNRSINLFKSKPSQTATDSHHTHQNR